MHAVPPPLFSGFMRCTQSGIIFHPRFKELSPHLPHKFEVRARRAIAAVIAQEEPRSVMHGQQVCLLLVCVCVCVCVCVFVCLGG